MAEWISDGFDAYAAVNDAALNYWDTSTGWAILAAANTRFGVGQGCTSGNGGTPELVKSVAMNDSMVGFAVPHFQTSGLGAAGTGSGWVISDGVTAQCGVWFELDGAIRLRAGGTEAGAILAAYTGAFIATVWNHFEIQVTIHNSAGAIHIRKNGAAVDDFSATGLNTRASANNYGNKFTKISNFSGHRYDDLFVYGNSGAAPTTWVGDIRCDTRATVTDTATKAFAPNPATYTLGTRPATSTTAKSANVIYYAQQTPTKSGVLSSVSINLSAGFTGHLNAALCADNGVANQPSTLIATATAVTNPAAGITALAFASPPALTASTKYFLAVWADAAFTLIGNSSPAVTANGATQALAYTGTFPASATPSSVTPTGDWFGTNTPYNASMVGEQPNDGSTTTVLDSVVGHADLYNIAAGTTTPASIIGVKARMLVNKSDTNAKTARLQLKSGATTVTKDLVLATTAQWCSTDFQPTDPDTGVAFTAGGVNALLPGPKVQA